MKMVWKQQQTAGGSHFQLTSVDLGEDGVIVGINWLEESNKAEDNEYVELDLAEFSQALAEIEAL